MSGIVIGREEIASEEYSIRLATADLIQKLGVPFALSMQDLIQTGSSTYITCLGALAIDPGFLVAFLIYGCPIRNYRQHLLS